MKRKKKTEDKQRSITENHQVRFFKVSWQRTDVSKYFSYILEKKENKNEYKQQNKIQRFCKYKMKFPQRTLFTILGLNAYFYLMICPNVMF